MAVREKISLAARCTAGISDWVVQRRYGEMAPRKFQLLYVVPSRIQWCLTSSALDSVGERKPAKRLGVVTPGRWDTAAFPLEDHPIIQRAEAGLAQVVQTGGSWLETADFQHRLQRLQAMGHDRDVTSRQALEQRGREYDQMIASARATGTIPAARERHGDSREYGGICILVGRRGELINQGDGKHRLAIARGLGLTAIPVCIAAVHPGALESGAWSELAEASDALQTQLLRAN